MKNILHILMIEDSASDAKLAARHVEQAGYEVQWDRVDAAAELKAALDRQAWDVILCDYTMAGFSGSEALALVRAKDQDLPFIFVSGTLGEDAAVEAMKAGAHDYVMKGNLRRLVPAIERELREAATRRDCRVLEANREQLVRELSEALKHVKRLSGLLSICACCKRIRNDRNEWQQLEVFIQERSEAQFSHGLCPDCFRRQCDGILEQAEKQKEE